MPETPMYEGARLQIGGAPMPEMRAHGVEAFAQERLAVANANRAQFVGQVNAAFFRMQEEKNLSSGNSKLADLQQKCDVEAFEGLTSAPGSEKSFFFEDGSVDQKKLDDFLSSSKKSLDDIDPGLITPELRDGFARHKEDFYLNVIKRLTGQALKMEMDSIARVCRAEVENALLTGNLDAAKAAVSRQRDAGILTPTEAANQHLSIARRALGYLGTNGSQSLNFNGRQYSGLSAVFAAAAARDGELAFPVADGTGDRDASSAAPLAAPPGGSADSAPAKEQARGMGEVSAAAPAPDDAMERALSDLDFGVLGSKIPLRDWVDFDGRVEARLKAIEQSLNPDGTPLFSCASSAPEAVQRVAAVANARGGFDKDTALGMVARMTLDEVARHPYTSAEDLVNVFDESGIYAAVGDGDEALGRARVGGIIREYQERARQGTFMFSIGNIGSLVKARVEDPDFGEGIGYEWKTMERLNPGKKGDEEYDKPKDEAGRARWFELYRIYEKYRPQFRPQLTGALEKDEFEEYAQEFYHWYMGDSHLYADAKRESRQAAYDWYMARIADTLQDSVRPGKDGKPHLEGYANDYGVVREVLMEQPPSDLGVQARTEWRESLEMANAKRSAALRKYAEGDAARLRAMKEKVAADKARENAAAKERDIAAEKRAEIDEFRRLNAARRAPVTLPWAWDEENAANGDMPACTIPEAEYKRLTDELGYDGSQDVYLRIQGTAVQVVGVNPAGRVLLNTTAAARVQKSPNARRGEKWRTRGDLKFSYQFKAIRTDY